MGFWLQLKLLLWKNFTLRKRQPARVVVELVWPLVLFIILVLVRMRPDVREPRTECHYEAKAMPSAGALAFLSSYLCNFNNECKNNLSETDIPGVINGFNNTLVGTFLDDFETILANNVDREDFILLWEDLQLLDEVRVALQNGTVQLESMSLRLGNVIISAAQLEDIVANQSIALTPEALDTLLNASLDIQEIVEAFSDSNRTRLNELLTITNDFANLANSAAGTPDNTSVQEILKIVCDDEILLRYFDFQSEARALDLQSQLCNLSLANATALAVDIGNNLNFTEIEKEIREIVESATGEQPNLNYDSIINAGSEIIRTLNSLTSLQNLFSNLTSAAADLSAQTSGINLSNDSLVSILGSLVCGGNKAIFSLGQDNEQDLQNEIDRQDQQGRVEMAKEKNEKMGLSPECANLFAGFEATQTTRILWRQLKPIVLGVITYAPDTPATQKIMKEASRTFDTFGSFLAFVSDVEVALPALESFLRNDIDFLRDFVDSPACKNLIYSLKALDSQLFSGLSSQLLPDLPFQLPLVLDSYLSNIDESVCDDISDFIAKSGLNGTYDWTDALNNTYNLLREIQPYFECIRLDKFVGYPDLASLVEASLEHIDNNTFWSAIVFDNIEQDEVDLPNLVKYTIRMDSDRVDSTKRIMSKYWRPGARGWLSAQRYWVYGFIYIQDMIDHAIIRLQTNVTQEPGVYTQQFPYPCYVWDKYWRPGNRDDIISQKYWVYGFIYIQDMIDHAIIRLQTNVTQEPGVYTEQFPYPCYVKDKFVFAISRSLPLFMVISWIYTVAMIVKGVVYEKEQRLKEVMKIMGLGNGVHWLAWFINSFVMMLITVILFVIILKAGKVLEYSDPSVVFVFMLGFTVSTISQCFLISVFFSRANLAAVCGGFIYFVLYLPYTQLVQWEDEITMAEKILACLSSNIAMGYCCSYFSIYEEQAIGAQWDNLADSPSVDDNFNLQTCIAMMFVDSIIYLLITWYIEAVFPGEYGMPRKWYFPIQKSYWLGHSRRNGNSTRADTEMPIEDIRDHSENFEKDPTDYPVGVAVRNLRKVYNKGDKVAVDGLTMNFYESQITSFLGHNGAGKTTTMSILTGLFPPTSGTAYIYGRDIMTDVDAIRTGLGMCPQHNVLFDLLTVEEHIWFYSRLKGSSDAEVKVELEQMIKDVGLPNKRKEKSQNLSGGMKRKLSVAIAFVGGSRTVILDEPTAGVDPYARRAIWELLLKFRKGRTIILSTHHMDEADVLGDRIAIISQGKLCTIGTSLFLKDRFGSGYYLTLVRQDCENDIDSMSTSGLSGVDSVSLSSRPSTSASVRTIVDVQPSFGDDDEGYDEKNGSDSNNSDDAPTPLPLPKKSRMVPGFNLPRLIAFIQKFIPGAVLVEDNSMEVCFRLPEDEEHAKKYQKLFAALEMSHRDMGISSYGISDTSLEEVFLKVAEDNSTAEDNDEGRRARLEEMSENGRYPRSVSKLSHKKKIQTSLFKLSYRNRVNSAERLTQDTDDTESIASEAQEAPTDINFSGAGEVKVSGKTLIGRQLFALFLKRLHHVRRSKKGFISEIILPALFVCLAMIFSLILPPFEEEPPLELQPWMYEPGSSSLYTFYSNDNPTNPIAEALEANLLKTPHYGNRCMNSTVYKISGKSCKAPKTNNVWTARPSDDSDIVECSCSSGFQRCPSGAGGPEPSKLRIQTNDIMYNATGRNLSDWLVKTMESYQKRRYGGFSLGEENPLGRLNASQISDAIDGIIRAVNNNESAFSGTEQLWKDLENGLKFSFARDNVKVWFNNKGWASSVSYMNAMNNLILRTLLPSDQNPDNYGIVTINHPMNLTKQQLNEETLYSSAVDVVVAICVIFAMSFVPASFVLFLIEERVSNSKHLQFVSGINPTIYWVANWAWDMLNYSIPALLCIFIFLAFGKESYVSAKNFPCLLALLFLYGWSITPMMYPFSRLFDVPSSAFVALSCVNVFLGTVSTLATFILELLQRDDPDLKDINDTLKQVFLLLPHYCLGRGLIDMASYQLQADVITRFGETLEYSLFEWNIVGRNIFSMLMLGIAFNILNLLIEYKFFLSWSFLSKAAANKVINEDIDVAKERERILAGGAANDVMRLEGLTKVYWTPGKKGKMTAVDHLYVGVPKGQCFGLLGVNGAGKTTTFKMLTGDVGVTEGDAFINNTSICKNMVEVRKYMGYCPQFDALDPLLTGREHLEFYARIRGISPSQIKSVADWAVKKLGLLSHADKISSSYSGGNKRKLSTAIALIGNPPVIFLDEPTTGMDPGARRFLWNCINSIVKAGRSVILTSHSMEECEALCNRLAIMVNGTFQCLGSIQHLKNRFGNGYTIILRVSGQNPEMTPVMQFITSSFPSAKLREKHHNMVQYQLGTDNLSLSKLFQAMEEAKKRYSVEDYSVSQTTLDQVFINFAKKQTDLMDEELDDNMLDIDDDFNDNNDDNLSCIFNADSVSTGVPSEFDEQSVTGSTVDLIRPGSGRSFTSRHGNNIPLTDNTISNVSV